MMDLSEINWDFNSAGAWPLQVKAAVILIVCCLVAGGGVYWLTLDQLAQLDTLKAEEQTLITQFEEKQKKAVNLVDYQAQLDEIQKQLKLMMAQMPTKAEVANLLSEISQSALTSGLEPRLFQPADEIGKEFYRELPYSIEVAGQYEELGLFVAGLATLSRIVTVHDIQLTATRAAGKEGVQMTMKATIKTYTEAAAEAAK